MNIFGCFPLSFPTNQPLTNHIYSLTLWSGPAPLSSTRWSHGVQLYNKKSCFSIVLSLLISNDMKI